MSCKIVLLRYGENIRREEVKIEFENGKESKGDSRDHNFSIKISELTI
jgi:hypothetical protein